MTETPKPEFLINQSGQRVGDAIREYLAHLRTTRTEPYELAIATAYFNPDGYRILAEELDHPSRLRLLIGAEPPAPDRSIRSLDEPANPERAHQHRLKQALEGHRQAIAEDRDLLGFTYEADAKTEQLVEWLRSGKVEVRRLEDQFLHGKAFIVTTHSDGVIAGSSNFTRAGLTTNLELNLGQYQPSVVDQVAEWFDELWERAQPYDLAALYEERYEPHSPWLIYLKMLYERYEAELSQEAEDKGTPEIQLTSFQKDGLWRAQRILENYNGVLIADEVGLGKTFLAGELIRQAIRERRQRVLVLAPATLRDGLWRRFLQEQQLGAERRSYEDLNRSNLDFELKEYAMVVVDEAHAFRNPTAQRSEALRQLLYDKPPKDLVMLTATPVNNSLWDLYNLLNYFLPNDAAFAHAGIRSLRDHFARAMALHPDDLSPRYLFDVLDAVSVRRTRPFVKRHYPNETLPINGKPTPITFPTPRVRKVNYELPDSFGNFFDRLAVALAGSEANAANTSSTQTLTLARYAPSQFLHSGHQEAYEIQLAGLLRSGLLKRFESSSHAFANTCHKMAASHDGFLSLLEQGKVATGRTLQEWMATDSDDLEELTAFLEEAEHEPAHKYDTEALRQAVEADRDLLHAFAEEASQVDQDEDPKLAALVEELAEIAAEARREGVGEKSTRDKRKVLIFSYFTDTVDWIQGYLERAVLADDRLADYRGRIAIATGSSGTKDSALWGFAPDTSDAPAGQNDDLYDILIATDVLAEGVNLQQTRHIINYDLPWNPMRLVQRHGRIDRIGSPHNEIFLRCIFPDQQLDELLNLEKRLQYKIKQASVSIGVAEGVLPGAEANEVIYAETREEIEALREEWDRLQAGDATLFENRGDSGDALSGEEYRKILEKALQDPERKDQLETLPWGSGSGMVKVGSKPGFVFCVRIADHPRPIYRAVMLDEQGEWEPPVSDTLACLAHAHPPAGEDTDRDLDDQTYERAYEAWELAQEDVFVKWMEATDPANLTPGVPKALRDAAQLIREHPPDIEQTEINDLLDRLEGPHPVRVQRAIRETLRANEDPQQRVQAIIDKVNELGLKPSPPPEPLPIINRDDIHLVCWIAIVSEPTLEESFQQLDAGTIRKH